MVLATMALAAMLSVAPWSLAGSEVKQPHDAVHPAPPKQRPPPAGMHVTQPRARIPSIGAMGEGAAQPRQPHQKAKGLHTLQPDLPPSGSKHAQADSKPSVLVDSSTAASHQAQKSPMKQAEAALANIDRLRFGSKHVAAQPGQHTASKSMKKQTGLAAQAAHGAELTHVALPGQASPETATEPVGWESYFPQEVGERAVPLAPLDASKAQVPQSKPAVGDAVVPLKTPPNRVQGLPLRSPQEHQSEPAVGGAAVPLKTPPNRVQGMGMRAPLEASKVQGTQNGASAGDAAEPVAPSEEAGKAQEKPVWNGCPHGGDCANRDITPWRDALPDTPCDTNIRPGAQAPGHVFAAGLAREGVLAVGQGYACSYGGCTMVEKGATLAADSVFVAEMQGGDYFPEDAYAWLGCPISQGESCSLVNNSMIAPTWGVLSVLIEEEGMVSPGPGMFVQLKMGAQPVRIYEGTTSHGPGMAFIYLTPGTMVVNAAKAVFCPIEIGADVTRFVPASPPPPPFAPGMAPLPPRPPPPPPPPPCAVHAPGQGEG